MNANESHAALFGIDMAYEAINNEKFQVVLRDRR